MTTDLDKYRLKGRVLLGDNLKLIFQSRQDKADKKVLELNSIAGFFDHLDKDDNLKWLDIRDPGGAYNDDLSMRLKKPRLINNKEVFIFLDDNRVNFGFRCSADNVQFRDWADSDKWLK